MKNTCIGTLSFLLLISQLAGADGKIEKIKPQNDAIRLTFSAETHATYQVQCSTNLTSGSWMDTGYALITFTNSGSSSVEAPADNCYYRIIRKADPAPAEQMPVRPTSTPQQQPQTPPPPPMF